MVKLLRKRDLRRCPDAEDDVKKALHKAEEAMINAVGNKLSESVYSLPSIGVMGKELDRLTPYVKQGRIDVDKIREGKEAILVVPSEMESMALDTIKVGESLPLSDVVLSPEEETYNFGYMRKEDYPEPVFKQMVTLEGADKPIPLTSYAFGHRKNIDVKVGAIVVLEDDSMLQRYSVLHENKSEEGPSYEMSLVCLPETFSQWGLPDNLFTDAQFKLKGHASIATANKDWYKIMTSCSGVSYRSAYEIKEQMERNAGRSV